MKKLQLLLLLTFTFILLSNKCKEQRNKDAQEKNEMIASLSRTPCYGKCPTYTITIYKDGKVIYDGKENVDLKGQYETTIPKEDVQAIKNMVKEINYFEMDEEYPDPSKMQIADIPYTITTVTLDGKTKTVRNGMYAPAVLSDFEKLLDNIFDKDKLVKMKSEK